MNYKINQMNNQFIERMAMQQRNFQERMWHNENAYNTPSAQRQRLQEAGLNPYLMMNGGSAGTSQSVGTGSSASSSGPAVMQPFQADFSGVQQAIGSVFQSQVRQAQVSQLQGQKNLADAQAMQALSVQSNSGATAKASGVTLGISPQPCSRHSKELNFPIITKNKN